MFHSKALFEKENICWGNKQYAIDWASIEPRILLILYPNKDKSTTLGEAAKGFQEENGFLKILNYIWWKCKNTVSVLWGIRYRKHPELSIKQLKPVESPHCARKTSVYVCVLEGCSHTHQKWMAQIHSSFFLTELWMERRETEREWETLRKSVSFI